MDGLRQYESQDAIVVLMSGELIDRDLKKVRRLLKVMLTIPRDLNLDKNSV